MNRFTVRALENLKLNSYIKGYLDKYKFKRTHAEINLDAIRANLMEMKEMIPNEVSLCAVVKADGYGHGAVPVAKAAEEFVSMYAVATAEEAIQLACHNVKKPVIILGPAHELYNEEIIKNNIRSVIFTPDEAMKLSKDAVRLGKKAIVHVAVDTGMHRIGLEPSEHGLYELKEMMAYEGIEVEGIFTHFSKADEREKSFTNMQSERFESFIRLLEREKISVPIKHVANSAAIIDRISPEFDMMRAGIAMYGVYPSDEVQKSNLSLIPALSLRSSVTYIKRLKKGESISYGGIYTADKDILVATVNVGYADGYPRGLSNQGDVLIHGKRCLILGRICMDQMMVDISEVPDVEYFDPVTLIGADGDEYISIDEVAERSGGFNYELMCLITKRVPRIYIENGRPVGKKDWNEDIYEDFDAYADSEF